MQQTIAGLKLKVDAAEEELAAAQQERVQGCPGLGAAQCAVIKEKVDALKLKVDAAQEDLAAQLIEQAKNVGGLGAGGTATRPVAFGESALAAATTASPTTARPAAASAESDKAWHWILAVVLLLLLLCCCAAAARRASPGPGEKESASGVMVVANPMNVAVADPHIADPGPRWSEEPSSAPHEGLQPKASGDPDGGCHQQPEDNAAVPVLVPPTESLPVDEPDNIVVGKAVVDDEVPAVDTNAVAAAVGRLNFGKKDPTNVERTTATAALKNNLSAESGSFVLAKPLLKTASINLRGGASPKKQVQEQGRELESDGGASAEATSPAHFYPGTGPVWSMTGELLKQTSAQTAL